MWSVGLVFSRQWGLGKGFTRCIFGVKFCFVRDDFGILDFLGGRGAGVRVPFDPRGGALTGTQVGKQTSAEG